MKKRNKVILIVLTVLCALFTALGGIYISHKLSSDDGNFDGPTTKETGDGFVTLSTDSEPNTDPLPNPDPNVKEAVYLGIENFAESNGANKDNFAHLFSINGLVESFSSLNSDSSYRLQNRLMEGYIYEIRTDGDIVTDVKLLSEETHRVVSGTIEAFDTEKIVVDGYRLMRRNAQSYEIKSSAGGAVVSPVSVAVGDRVKVTVSGSDACNIYKSFVSEKYSAPVSGTAGKKTLKNFLALAMEPVGTCLYVYGGGWNWQDETSANQAMTIGVPQSWVDFFQAQDENYVYQNKKDPAKSYYSRQYNEYYYAGLDCSGYVGWVMYNLLHTESSTVSDSDGYVKSSTGQAGFFADMGLGTMDMGENLKNKDGSLKKDSKGHVMRAYYGEDHTFRPGDIFSMNGHTWISLGTCTDGSVVIIHSTPRVSGGAGVQLSAIGNDKQCEAYQLANYYMNEFYPLWAERYGDSVLCLDFGEYTVVHGKLAGRFRWNLNNAILDPDGYANMTPREILEDLFS